MPLVRDSPLMYYQGNIETWCIGVRQKEMQRQGENIQHGILPSKRYNWQVGNGRPERADRGVYLERPGAYRKAKKGWGAEGADTREKPFRMSSPNT